MFPDFPGPTMGPYSELRAAVQAALESMLQGDATPEQALADAQAQVDEALAAYSG